MQGNLMHMRCDSFASELASKKSVPGGGAASAYVGALGAALAQMVCNFTIGKKRYADVEQDMIRICSTADAIRLRLLELADEDAESFAPLAEAYAIPRSDPTREERVERATMEAIRCPLEIMRLCCEAIELIDEVRVKGSAMLLSDTGCAASICRAALESGAMNVLVNTSALKRSEFALKAESECIKMLDAYVPLANGIVADIFAEMRLS